MSLRRRFLRAPVLACALVACACSNTDEGNGTVNADITAAASDGMYVAGYSNLDRGFVKHLEGDAWVMVHESRQSATAMP